MFAFRSFPASLRPALPFSALPLCALLLAALPLFAADVPRATNAHKSNLRSSDDENSRRYVAQKSLSQRIDVKAIRFNLGKEQVVLGETKSVSVKLTATLPDGTPLDVAPPRLRASTGTLSPPQRTGPGAWSTTFTPPKQRFPHVAILSAQIDTLKGPSVGFASLPLWGKGQLEVKTKPNSEVVVFLGNRQFGPAKSGKTGLARVDILAPPGPERAVAKSTDEVGNQSQETVDLKVPAFNRLAIIPIDEVTSADGKGVAQVLIFLVDKKGVPMYDAPVTVKATVGGLQGEPQGLAPGVFRLYYHPGKTSEKEARLDVTLKGKGAEASKATFRIRLLPGGPVRANITGEVHKRNADEAREISVVVQLFDEANNIVPLNAGKIDVDKGRISRVEARDDQRQEVFWIVPAELEPATSDLTNETANKSQNKAQEKARERERNVATLRVRSRDGGILAEWKIERSVGKLAKIAATHVEPIVADGNKSVKVELTGFDRAGNAVFPAAVQIEVERGRVLSDFVEEKSRHVHLVFDRVEEHQSAKLRFFVPQKETAPVDVKDLILPLEQNIRLIPPRIRTKLLVGVGIISDWNFSRALASGVEGSFHLRLPVFDGSLHAGLRIAALMALPVGDTVEGGSYELYQTTVPLLFEGEWRNEHLLDDVLPGVVFFAGGSLGLVFAETTHVYNEIDVKRRLTTAVGAGAFGGVGYAVGPGTFEAELHLLAALPFTTTTYLATPMGLGLTLRYRFAL